MALMGRVIALLALIVLGFALFAYGEESASETVAAIEAVNEEQKLLEVEEIEDLEDLEEAEEAEEVEDSEGTVRSLKSYFAIRISPPSCHSPLFALTCTCYVPLF